MNLGLPTKPATRARKDNKYYVLTAGHCNGWITADERYTYRSTDSDNNNEANWRKIGKAERDALHHFEPVSTDAAAIRVEKAIVPGAIFGWGGRAIPTKPSGRVRIGDTVCYSGTIAQVPHCGDVVHRSIDWKDGGDGYVRGGYWVTFKKPAVGGCSGAPVWAGSSQASIGLVSAGRKGLTETLVEPLLHPPNMPTGAVVGILHNKHMAPLQLNRWK